MTSHVFDKERPVHRAKVTLSAHLRFMGRVMSLQVVDPLKIETQ